MLLLIFGRGDCGRMRYKYYGRYKYYLFLLWIFEYILINFNLIILMFNI